MYVCIYIYVHIFVRACVCVGSQNKTDHANQSSFNLVRNASLSGVCKMLLRGLYKMLYSGVQKGFSGACKLLFKGVQNGFHGCALFYSRVQNVLQLCTNRCFGVCKVAFTVLWCQKF